MRNLGAIFKMILFVILAAVAAMLVGILIGDTNESEPIAERVQLRLQDLEIIEFSERVETYVSRGDGSLYFVSINFVAAVDRTHGEQSYEIIETLRKPESDYVMRSIAFDVVSEKTYEELGEPGAMYYIERELLARFRQEFGSNLIYRVMISGEWAI